MPLLHSKEFDFIKCCNISYANGIPFNLLYLPLTWLYVLTFTIFYTKSNEQCTAKSYYIINKHKPVDMSLLMCVIYVATQNNRT